jgi:hypothetical protein
MTPIPEQTKSIPALGTPQLTTQGGLESLHLHSNTCFFKFGKRDDYKQLPSQGAVR